MNTLTSKAWVFLCQESALGMGLTFLSEYHTTSFAKTQDYTWFSRTVLNRLQLGEQSYTHRLAARKKQHN